MRVLTVMRNKVSIILVVVVFTGLSRTGWGLENSAIRNPVGLGTVPPSSIRSGLIRTPNPIDTSSNLVVTGNVGGGKHFRGVLPYNAISDFGGRLGTGTLDSFLRYSAGSERFGRYTGKLTPFYSQTGTVTRIAPGSGVITRPPTLQLGGRAVGGTTVRALSREKIFLGPDTVISNIRNRAMSIRLRELEGVISNKIGEYSQTGEPTYEQDRGQMKRLRPGLKVVSDKLPKLKRSLISRDDSLRLPATKKPSDDVRRWFEERRQKEPASVAKKLDIYEQMKQQADEFQKILEQLEEVTDVEKEPGEQSRDFVSSRKQKRAFGAAGRCQKMGRRESSRKKSTPLDGFSDAELSATAKAILGQHKSFASFSKDKFNQHIRVGEAYLKQGKHYRAADAYTLASIYKPGDPLAYAGKSHALFAAGEYMSSALFLSRALEIFPEYALFKIDIEAMVGDRDKLESRIAEVEQWWERSKAAELKFLLAYVYYQMGRLDRAKEAIDVAYEKMPELPAVIAIRKAISRGLVK